VIRVIILAGNDVLGVHYCEDTPMDISDNFAVHLVGRGIARFAIDTSTASIADLRTFVLEQIGHTEVFDDCATDGERRAFVESYLWEVSQGGTGGPCPAA